MAPDLWLRLANFVDCFRRSPQADRVEQVREPLCEIGDTVGTAIWGAVTESLCRECGLPAPAWTEDRSRFLPAPHFEGGMESLKAILLVESPIPFRRRNIFVSENALSRI